LSKKKLLITGSSGFVGRYATGYFKDSYDVETLSLRNKLAGNSVFQGVDSILHLAGKAHVMGNTDPQEYFDINRDLAVSFAQKAKDNGVSQFIYISSTKVYGDDNSSILDEFSTCQPNDPYGESKYEAEQELLKLNDTAFTITIIRPPLIYGKGVKGNLARISKLIDKLPIIPFGGIQNKRSMVYVGNLTALVDHVINNRSQGVYIAGDDKAYSTTYLVETILKNKGLSKKNVVLPKFLLSLIRTIKPKIYSRLFDSYEVTNTKTNKRLNFNPPFSFEEGIKEMITNI
jgi:UDP-glucose 4-epimerase